ncbi:pbs lyase : : HEAT_2 [Gemmata massiliana]|uniref:Pbs lyase:: HEAT_2 n=1 Tax=Gemmata massiliana TaxID=1210884 RepID=A0A6P2CPN4_9BACT|nr:HEAT repeat domain-containing protein [Gemmata massiliana]VTR90978.1 pbs lyase : : HEAT_2 [Gemmata massiliana]
MQPASPSVTPPGRGAGAAALRGTFALLLALFVAALVSAQPPAPGAAQPKKEPDQKEPEKKEPAKLETRWPTDINGKDLKTVMKDMEDPDPATREFAARTLSSFGPPAQKGDVSKLLLRRMTAERDPSVRFAVYGAVGAIAFDAEADNKEALRILADVVDTGVTGGASRYQAVQTITMFGPRAYETIVKLTGVAMTDASYETRRAIAGALGRVAFSETTGPNMKALTALADVLAKDASAPVRMEALQSLMLLGPPWDGVKKADSKVDPPINAKSAAVIISYMKHRVGDPKTKTPGLEKDRQVEIWARLVLMRFDPREINDDNMEAFARHLSGAEVGVKAQALQALSFMGESGAKKLNAVVRLLGDKEQPIQLTITAINTIAAMGAGAKPAIPDLKKLVTDTEKIVSGLKDQERKAAEGLLKLKDQERRVAEEMLKVKEHERRTNEELVKLVERAIKHIEDAKPTSPAVAQPEPKKQ